MIIVRLIGGMGNQMFQYAFARNLMLQYGGECYLDLTWYKEKNRKKHEVYMLDRFQLYPGIKLITTKKELNEKVNRKNRKKLWRNQFCYKVVFHLFGREKAVAYTLKKNQELSRLGIYDYGFWYDYLDFEIDTKLVNYFIGYWQTETYFYQIGETLKREFQIKEGAASFTQVPCPKEKNCKNVAIHIRAGDYLENDNVMVCTDAYYQKAVHYLKQQEENLCFYIFSNDITWVKEHMAFAAMDKFIFVTETKNALEDFISMIHCDSYIISNSTFCWWAQYLSKAGENRIVIAPKNWTKNKMIQDIYQENWIRI